MIKIKLLSYSNLTLDGTQKGYNHSTEDDVSQKMKMLCM